MAKVTNLVKWPVAITGRFEKILLELPQEVLVSQMTEHQRYFPVEDNAGRLLPYFVAVSNTNVSDR